MGLENRRQPVVSIIIPTVNQVELVEKCIVSLLKSGPSAVYPWEMIVVDDGSPRRLQDDLRDLLRPYPVRLLAKEKNTGFAATVNAGAAAGRGNFLCLVNNDVFFSQKNWLDYMMREVLKSRVGVVGSRLLYPDGRIQHGGIFYLPAQRIFDHEYRYRPGNHPPALRCREVLGVTGALMLVNRVLWEKLGGMDERFFIALEDVDFSLRTWERGWRVVYTGSAFAVHYEGYTRGRGFTDKNPFWLAKEMKSMERFFQKWLGRLSLLRVAGGNRNESISRAQAFRWRRIIARRKKSSAIRTQKGWSADESALCQFRNTGISRALRI